MKKTIAIILTLVVVRASAQTWVTIPDAAFSTYLRNNITAAMHGDSLNISSPLVTSTTYSLNLSDLGVSNLSGVQYFTSLTYLNCSGNTFTTLPALPNTLTYLDCSFNSHLTMLPALPNSIQTLWCQNDSLISIAALPTQLQALYCFNNYLTALPTLPNTLQSLECYYNSLASLPALPNALKQIDCFYNALTNMPPLNDSLTNLDCHNNLITSFSSLGSSLAYLYCSNNNLTILPTMPASLVKIDCSYNSFVHLPTLPVALTYLDCSNNQLIDLPALPSLNQLYCENNSISCFPTFPNTINLSYFNSCLHGITYFIDISNNPFTCVPNIIAAMGADSVNYQRCTAGNVNGCKVAGIEQFVNSNEVSIYPNPASTSLTLTLSKGEGTKATIYMYDMLGKLVKQSTYSPPSEGQGEAFDISDLAEGVYTISITTTECVLNKSMIKVR
ncbi:MAG: T9SS type A sorting domain-containing protein [Bacteroidia bacterium]